MSALIAPRAAEELGEKAEELRESIREFAALLRRAGGRESSSDVVRYFCAYQLAGLEGKNDGWLGSDFLADALDDLPADLEREQEEAS